jgi:hypothetical protein
MKHLTKYLPYIFACSLFFVGRFSAPDKSKELERKYELERKTLRDQIKDLEVAMVDKDKAGEAIREKMYSDSLKTASVLKSNNEAYLVLLKKYEKINYSRASTSELDSLRAGILHALPTPQ